MIGILAIYRYAAMVMPAAVQPEERRGQPIFACLSIDGDRKRQAMMINSRTIYRLSWLFVLSVAAIIFITSTIYTLLAWPTNDDICRATIRVHSIGDVFGYAHYLYMTWTGRWLAMGLYAAFIPSLGIATWHYTAVLIALQLGWVAIFYGAVHLGFEDALSVIRKLGITALITCVFWAGMTAPLDNWYWLMGTFEYVVPLGLAAIGVWLLTKDSFRNAVIAAAIGILIGGFNEFVAIIYVVMIGTWGLIAFLSGYRRQAGRLAVALAGAIAGFLINYLAPGTSARAHTQFGDGSSSIVLLIKSFMKLDHSPISWFIDPRLWALTAFALLSNRFRSLRPSWCKPHIPLFLWIPLVCLITTMAAYLAVQFAQGSLAPKRALNTIYAVFIIGWLLGLINFASYYKLKPLPAGDALVHARAFMLFLLGVGLLLSNNTENAMGDMSYTLNVWRPAKVELFTGTAHDVALDKALRYPRLYAFEALTTDLDGFGRCYTTLLGKHLYLIDSGRTY
jgi:hypothetical protein